MFVRTGVESERSRFARREGTPRVRKNKLCGYNSARSDKARHYPVPVKFWQCVGDPVVSFDVTQRFVNEIRENGGVAYLRAFPYGGHEPQLVGKPIARPSGNTVVDGKTLQILPAVEKAFVWMRNFD